MRELRGATASSSTLLILQLGEDGQQTNAGAAKEVFLQRTATQRRLKCVDKSSTKHLYIYKRLWRAVQGIWDTLVVVIKCCWARRIVLKCNPILSSTITMPHHTRSLHHTLNSMHRSHLPYQARWQAASFFLDSGWQEQTMRSSCFPRLRPRLLRRMRPHPR